MFVMQLHGDGRPNPLPAECCVGTFAPEPDRLSALLLPGPWPRRFYVQNLLKLNEESLSSAWLKVITPDGRGVFVLEGAQAFGLERGVGRPGGRVVADASDGAGVTGHSQRSQLPVRS